MQYNLNITKAQMSNNLKCISKLFKSSAYYVLKNISYWKTMNFKN